MLQGVQINHAKRFWQRIRLGIVDSHRAREEVTDATMRAHKEQRSIKSLELPVKAQGSDLSKHFIIT